MAGCMSRCSHGGCAAALRAHTCHTFCPSRAFHTAAPHFPHLQRLEGKVTAIKNQQSCGSCWAFAATAAVESMHLIRNPGKMLMYVE